MDRLDTSQETHGIRDAMLPGEVVENELVPGGKVCILLAGVYCGGDHVLARVLHHLGADSTNAGDRRIAGANEETAFTRLNSEILASAGAGFFSIEPFNAGWYASPRHAEFHARAINLVKSQFRGSFFYLLNDPGLGRLVPFWRGVLQACDVTAAVINYYEDPASFVRHIGTNSGVGAVAAHTLWTGHVLEAERCNRSAARAHVTLESLVQDWEGVLARLQQDLGVVWPAWSSRVRSAIVAELLAEAEAARDVSVRKLPAEDNLSRWAQEAQAVLWRWARDGEDERGRARLDELADLFGEARDLVGEAVDTIVDLGKELRGQRAQADGQLARIEGLQQQIDALSAIEVRHSGELAALRGTLAQVEAERDLLRSQPDHDKDSLAGIEARWAEIFGGSRQDQEILTEQNVVFQNAIAHLSAELQELEHNLATSLGEIERLRLVELAQKSQIKTAVTDVSRARKNPEEARTAAKMGAAVDGPDSASHERMAVARGAQARRSKAYLSFRKLTQVVMPTLLRKALRRRELRELVTQSGLFDAKFYAARYPDIVEAGADPLDHFIKFGGAEGRHPSEAFNSKWYLTEYPDIRNAGINPLLHYLEHGRDEGRRRRALTDAGLGVEVAAMPAVRVANSAPTRPPQLQAEPSELDSSWRPRATGWKALLNSEVANPATGVTHDQLADQAGASAITLCGMTVGLLAEAGAIEALGRLALFAALRSETAAGLVVAGKPLRSAPAHGLVAVPGCGIEYLADGYFDGQNLLKLRFSAGFSGVARAFQFDPSGALACVAEAVLGGTDADLLELQLLNPLNEVLVVLCAANGILCESVVLPFPSLMRGGLHHGELAVMDTAPGGIRTLADYTRSLVMDLLGWPDGPPAFAISRVLIDMRGTNGTEPIFRPDVLEALTGRFGIAVSALAGSAGAERGSLIETLSHNSVADVAGRETAGPALVLPCDMLPSIYSIAGRRAPRNLAISRFAVMDSATLKPRADISMPVWQPQPPGVQHSDLPAHAPYVIALEEGHSEMPSGNGSPVFPLAVRHYNKLSWQIDPLMPVSPDQGLALAFPADAGCPQPLVTVIVDAGHDDAQVVACIAALMHQVLANRIDIVLAGWADDRPLPDVGHPVRTFDGHELTRAGRLNAAASLDAAPYLLFLDPAVLMSDPRTLQLLVHIAGQPGTASAACALVTGLADDDNIRIHSAGYFPTRISLCGDPVFDFDQVDVTKVLPAATYPVAANHLRCCVISRIAWSALGGFDAARFPSALFDLDFGNRAVAAGLPNYCTTLIRAATDQVIAGADFPDPLAHRSIRPADWQTMFDSVTVIREMRR
jgi:hypothetical protein